MKDSEETEAQRFANVEEPFYLRPDGDIEFPGYCSCQGDFEEVFVRKMDGFVPVLEIYFSLKRVGFRLSRFREGRGWG